MADKQGMDVGVPGQLEAEMRELMAGGMSPADAMVKMQGSQPDIDTKALLNAYEKVASSEEGATAAMKNVGMSTGVTVDPAALETAIDEEDKLRMAKAQQEAQEQFAQANRDAADEWAKKKIAEEEAAKAQGPYIEMDTEEAAAIMAEAEARESRVSTDDKQAYKERSAARRAARAEKKATKEPENPMLNLNAQGDLDDRLKQSPGHETTKVIQKSDAGVQHQVIQSTGDVSTAQEVLTADELPELSEGDKVRAGEIGENLAAEGTSGGKSANPRDVATPSTPARGGEQTKSASASV